MSDPAGDYPYAWFVVKNRERSLGRFMDPFAKLQHNDESESYRHIEPPSEGSPDLRHGPMQLPVYLLHAV